MFRYSKPYKRGDLLDYWFGLPKEKFEKHSPESFFVLFICGSYDQVLVIPASYYIRTTKRCKYCHRQSLEASYFKA